MQEGQDPVPKDLLLSSSEDEQPTKVNAVQITDPGLSVRESKSKVFLPMG